MLRVAAVVSMPVVEREATSWEQLVQLLLGSVCAKWLTVPSTHNSFDRGLGVHVYVSKLFVAGSCCHELVVSCRHA